MRDWLDRHPLLGNRAFRAVAVFLAGFLFDILTLDRVDSLLQIAQQVAFLAAVYVLIRFELRETRGAEIPEFLKRHWKHKDLALQFLLGGLLSAFLIFYFKSASIAVALGFILFMCALLILNEFLRTRRFRIDLHLALFSICLTSFWIVMVPTLAGSIRGIFFYAAIAISVLCLYLAFKKWILTQTWKRSVPIFAVPAIFVIFNFLEWIPPVPLAVKSMAVYRSIEKKDGKYQLTYLTSPWLFWRSGDQVFEARPGDALVLFMRVFAPARFDDQLQVVWKLKTARGVDTLDRIPLNILGGRDEGFRGYITKTQYVPGHWIASLQTREGREIGRLNVYIEADLSTEPRELRTRFE